MRPALYLLTMVVGLVLTACTGLPTPTAAPGSTMLAVGTHTPSPDPTPVPTATAPVTPTPRATAPLPTALPTQAPTATPTVAPSPVTPGLSSPQRPAATGFPPAPDRDLYRLAAELSLEPAVPRVVNPTPVSHPQGRKDTFWLVDLARQRMYQQSFELRLVSPRAYWYVEEGSTVPQQDLERAAASFEAEVYPRVTAAFGQEWSPGVDNDVHLNILNARLRGVGGYFSGGDEHPQQAFPYSNQREMVYINVAGLQIGSDGYMTTLAHELQHLIHWNGDPTEETWVNEGLSELASTLSMTRRLSFGKSTPEVSLIHWPINQAGVVAHYQAASVFTHYLWEHYTREDSDLMRLVRQPANGVEGISAYLKEQGYPQDFRQVFQDWVVANLLDEAEGPYGYRSLGVQPKAVKSLSGPGQLSSQVPQYAAQYVELKDVAGRVRLKFEGAPENTLVTEDVGVAGCWWSNSGDTISSALTRAVDLTGLAAATLTYQVWYEVEEGWDYGYLEVSSDNGKSWTVLEAPHTSAENPIGNSFGPGYTGNSRGWLDERVSLSAFAGKQVLLRFHYVTDDAVSGTGLCLRQISVPEAGVMPTDQGWQADGFILTDNRVAQEYLVQLIQTGTPNQVTVMSLDSSNRGDVEVHVPDPLGRLVVVVAALAPKTRQPAPYTLTMEPAH